MVVMPLVQPQWWRDKFGGRPLLVWCHIIGMGVFQPFVYAYMTGSPHLYTVIFCWSIWGGLIGAITTAAGGAFGMDILPSDDEGRPLNAARDM
eukprot:SAG22_NODE_8334_length_663_cov_1.345745_1_plen_92_part_01